MFLDKRLQEGIRRFWLCWGIVWMSAKKGSLASGVSYNDWIVSPWGRRRHSMFLQEVTCTSLPVKLKNKNATYWVWSDLPQKLWTFTGKWKAYQDDDQGNLSAAGPRLKRRASFSCERLWFCSSISIQEEAEIIPAGPGLKMWSFFSFSYLFI